jgi:uncharacterized RDD family membrane protein YckC
MSCPLCGDYCRCDPRHSSAKARPQFRPHFEPHDLRVSPGAADAVLIDPEEFDASELQFAASLEDAPAAPSRSRFVVDAAEPAFQTPGRIQDAAEPVMPATTGTAATFAETARQLPPSDEFLPVASEPAPPNSWRQEVAARVHRYHSRRKPRAPRYPSLRLKFETDSARADSIWSGDLPARSAPISPRIQARTPLQREQPAPSLAVTAIEPVTQIEAAPRLPETTGKLIAFPRSSGAAPVRLDELAEPVIDTPRILEAPEISPPPPALGGILIEPAAEPEQEKRPGIDVPLQSAALSRRLFATAADGLLVAAALAVFGYIFLRMSPTPLVISRMIRTTLALAAVFWVAYQYLFLVHTGSTPGLKLARLRLSRFDGTPASRRRRQWRVLVSILSAAPLGMGYAWYFLDEDALCWHDRITQTYLGPIPQKR